MIEGLLKAWSDLENDRCGESHISGLYLLSSDRAHCYISTKQSAEGDLVELQAFVQDAIVARNLGCIIHRSTHSDWEAKISRFSFIHAEPAIALLQAYVEYLRDEQNTKAAIAGGAK